MLSKYITLFLLIAIQLLCYQVVYINSDGGCYYISDKPEDWFDALTVCQLLGRCLASFSTAEIFASFTKQVTNNSKLNNVEFWTGINSYEKNVFAYVEDSTLMRYVPPGVNLDPEDSCAHVKIQDGKLILKSDLCCEKKRFICADATVCNKRKLKIHHTLVLDRENEKADDICQSLSKPPTSTRTGLTKTRTGKVINNGERKVKTRCLWTLLLKFMDVDTSKVW